MQFKMDDLYIADTCKRRVEKYAIASFPNEICGFLSADGTDLIPVKNTHTTPTEAFRMSPESVVRGLESNASALVHSHVNGLASPTEQDMRQQEAMQIPWGIVVLDAQKTVTEQGVPHVTDWVWFGDQLPIQPYEGRVHIVNVQDCWSLVRDWYRKERGVTLPIFPREPKWYLKHTDLITPARIAEAGLIVVETTELQIGDILAMQLGQNTINHLALYLGNELILHHVAGYLSRVEPVYRWLPFMRKVLRYGGIDGVAATPGTNPPLRQAETGSGEGVLTADLVSG